MGAACAFALSQPVDYTNFEVRLPWIERIPQTHRYRVTNKGWRLALFCTRCYNRVLRPGLAQLIPSEAVDDSRLRQGFDRLDEIINNWLNQQKVPA